ncbi:MAG: hypothetical protein M1830_001211 [Pleopsidium flavum]|nr:MAG: hypothetical protein M1830_001211 [Pleopsidium flavum]
MLEDDVIALNGSWEFLYLRLFYTEEFLGWNSEEWPNYIFYSALWVFTPALCLLWTRHYFPMMKRPLSNQRIMTGCGLCIPLCILLFFAAGRVTVAPLPPGVNEMNNFGCCSQGFVFPHSKASDLIRWYESKKIGFVDMLTEEYADANHETRWAITPSVLQHVGRKSSKGDDFGKSSKYHMSVAEKLWNFEFERGDAESLREEEHGLVASTGYR